MNAKVRWALLAVVVIVASVLRFGDLGLIEFKGDEAVAVALAMPLVEGEALPKVGLMSSVGIHNPPLFIWLTAAPLAISIDPRLVTALLVGLLSVASLILGWFSFQSRFGTATALIAMTFYAAGTWPVIYARKIWAQNVLPIFSLAVLHLLFVVWERPRTRWVAAGPVLLCALWQIHFSAFAIIIIAVALTLWRWRTLNWPWLGLGTVMALLLLWPYLDYQRNHDWQDLKGLQNVASGKRADGTAREAPKEWTLEPVRQTVKIVAGTDLSYSLGHSTEAFRDQRSNAAAGAAKATRWIGDALLAAGTLLLLALIGRRSWRRRRGVPPGALEGGHAPRVILAWFVLGYLAIFTWARLEHVYPHYFTILYPAPFLLMALPLGEAARRWRAGAAAAAVITVLVAGGHLWNLAEFRGFLRAEGGTRGDYGVIYEPKADLTAWMATHGLEYERAGGWEYGHLLDMARRYGDMPALAERVADRKAPPPGRRRVRVHNAVWHPHVRDLRCPGKQVFDPLIACPIR